MAKKIEWSYHRNGCTTCGKAKAFLETNAVPAPQEVVDAKKVRFDRDGAIALARKADRVVIGKGKKVVVLDLKAEKVDDDTLAGHLLGPTGNLKAPTIRVGKTLYVGFNEEAYAELKG